MTSAEFLNRVKILYSIDHWQLAELTNNQWLEFVRDPPRFLMRADDFIADAILREVEARQQFPAHVRKHVPSIPATQSEVV